jgi:hypothetical protein
VSTLTDVDIDLGKFNIGDTDRIEFTVTKDGVPWDLTAADVTLVFEKPDRATRFSRTMTVDAGAPSVAYYDTAVGDVLTAGWWTLTVKIVDGIVVKRYPYSIGFEAVDEP